MSSFHRKLLTTLLLLKAGEIITYYYKIIKLLFITSYLGPQHSYFPLALWVCFHSLLEVREQAEDHNQLESQEEAEAYLIIHADDCQEPLFHGFSYLAKVYCRAVWARRVGAEGT